MPASLYGLSKYWYTNESFKEVVSSRGIQAMVVTESKGGLAKKDPWHAVNNHELVEPIIYLMKNQGLISTPYLPDIEKEVLTFLVLIAKKPVNDDTMGSMKALHDVDIHLVSTSIKKIMGFLRKRYLATNIPRDRQRVSEKYF